MLSSGWLICGLSLLVLAAPCPTDMSGVIPLGCPVELTPQQKALLFEFKYNFLEECTWSVNNQPVGNTHDQQLSQRTLTSGQTAVVANYVLGQSDLILTTLGEASALEGTEVKSACQPRGGEQGSTREAKTVIGETNTYCRLLLMEHLNTDNRNLVSVHSWCKRVTDGMSLARPEVHALHTVTVPIQ